jgi:hypothetical protein
MFSAKKETPPVEPEASDLPEDDINWDSYPDFPLWDNDDVEVIRQNTPAVKEKMYSNLDPLDNTLLGKGVPNFVLDPGSVKNFPPLATPEQLEAMQRYYMGEQMVRPPIVREIPDMSAGSQSVFFEGAGIKKGFDREAAWIQTHSGRRFCPTSPNPKAIVIQDVAHALAMQCRFSGHCRKFYSVAQHSVLVSHICDSQDALWGLLHDASEAYLVDVPRPLKRSGKLQGYIEFEAKMQEAVCRRFGLPLKEPPSVKRADQALLATEARDLMSPLHPDWDWPIEPLPFLIEPWEHQRAKDMFMKRFFELTGSPHGYEHYLHYKDQL